VSQPRLIYRIGTRQSPLALWQAEAIQGLLQGHHPNLTMELVLFTTQGDRKIDQPLPQIGGKGVFTLELENALRSGEIDLAVHSLKDLPTELDEAFTLGATPERGSPFDALVSRNGKPLRDLPKGAVIGTSSLRRSAQLQAYRSDLKIQSIRGNVDTRLRKILDPNGEYDAGVLALAGLQRLGKTEAVTEILDVELMLPAPGQGALAVQCRAGDAELLELLRPLDHAETRACVLAERAFLRHLEAGCRLPVSAYAIIEEGTLQLIGRVSSLNGSLNITVKGTSAPENGTALGVQLAEQALAQGAGTLLEAIEDEL
jgi:hydroxymethylbilane synthase